MRLVLIRHGDAENFAARDFDRVLTAKGRDQAAGTGEFLAAAGVRPLQILSSPYRRAQATAAIIAQKFNREKMVIEEPRLGCGCTPETAVKILQEADARGCNGDVIWVGHQPDCGEITEYFCGGGQYAFKKCAAAFINLWEFRRGGGELAAFVPPLIF